MNALIDPRESYRVAYDLTIHKEVYPHGDLVVVMTWQMITGRPIMVIVPKGILSHERVIPCVVTLENAWKWAEETGDTEWATTTAVVFCANLNFNPYNQKNVFRLMSMIRGHLGDLISMPPMPDDARQPAAEMLITDNATGRTTEKEVTDHA